MKFKPGDRARIVKARLKPEYVGTECTILSKWETFMDGEWYWVRTHDGKRVCGPDYALEPISPAREWFDENIQIPLCETMSSI
jgi:hypothetical protein